MKRDPDLMDRIAAGEVPAVAYCNRCNAKEVHAGICPQCGPGEFRFVPIPKEPIMAKKKATKEVLNVAAHFANVSIGDQVASIGVKIERSSLTVEKADEVLCGRRLAASVLVLPTGEDVSQKTAFDKGDRHEIEGTFDVKSFRVSPKNITATLAFALNEIEPSELGHVAQKSGRLIVNGLESLPEKVKKAPTDSEEDDF